MVTKELKANKKCCLYASDFHLEMILLPYIKENLNKSDFVIMTQNDMYETLKILLDRVNMSKDDKNKIINLDWKSDNVTKIDLINNKIKENKNINIIIKGNKDYINKVNDNLKSLINDKVHIIDCFCIEDYKDDIDEIKRNYNEVLNTTRI